MDSGIGAGVDSYFEYLLKGGILFGIPRLINMFEGKGLLHHDQSYIYRHKIQPWLFYTEYYGKIKKYLKHSDWYIWVNMNKGQITMPIFQSLEAFWPGLQVLKWLIGISIVQDFPDIFSWYLGPLG